MIQDTRSDRMLKSKANWVFLDEEQSKDTSIVDQLLEQRGMYTEDEKQQFLHPDLKQLQPPVGFNQIEIAKQRVQEAIEAGELIVVYGDYDADGVTGTTVIMKTLRKLGANCQYYIPNRFDEGYGLSVKAIESFANENVSLIITVDTGVANVDEVDYANDLGIDVIITDHHEVQTKIPNAYAIIHPALSPNYSFKYLAGVGVAFQFSHFLLGQLPEHVLDLVAIGTIADLVPLLGENRALVTMGLQRLEKTESIGLRALMKNCKIESPVNERDIGFLLAPRINAVGRLQDATLAVKLLLTDDENEANEIASQIEQLNSERKQIVQKIVNEAEQQVDEDDYFIVLADSNWNEGVLGIAASRLVSSCERPVMLLTINEQTKELKGSARSIPAFDLFENGMKIRELFTKFGGHSQAAGMSFPVENLPQIKAALNKQVKEQVAETAFREEITINRTIELEDMTEELVYELQKFAPFGMENKEPLFHLKAIPTTIRQLGQDKQHLKMQFYHQEQTIDAIGFRLGHLAYFISQHTPVSLVGSLDVNEWNGKRTVQMVIKDMAVNEWQLFDFRGRPNVANLIPYVQHYEQKTLVGNDLEQFESLESENLQLITYETANTTMGKSDVLFINDLPNSLSDLQDVISKVNPSAIHVSYQAATDAYLQSIPGRDEFKWVYGYVKKYSPVHLKVDLPKMMQEKRLTKDRIIFILKVFMDLDFVRIHQNVITLNQVNGKKELSESRTYQNHIEQSKIEKILYYSTYDELKHWFQEQMGANNMLKEEASHGL